MGLASVLAPRILRPSPYRGPRTSQCSPTTCCLPFSFILVSSTSPPPHQRSLRSFQGQAPTNPCSPGCSRQHPNPRRLPYPRAASQRSQSPSTVPRLRLHNRTSCAQQQSRRVNASSHTHVPCARRGVVRSGSGTLRFQILTTGSGPSLKTVRTTARYHVSPYAILSSSERAKAAAVGSVLPSFILYTNSLPEYLFIYSLFLAKPLRLGCSCVCTQGLLALLRCERPSAHLSGRFPNAHSNTSCARL
jgi:hypothetical protein